MPPVQPMQPASPEQPIQPVSPEQLMQPGQLAQPLQPLSQPMGAAQPVVSTTQLAQSPSVVTSVPTSAQMAAAAAAAMQPKKSHATLIMGIVIGALVIIMGVFIGLFVWKNGEFADLEDNFDLKIAEAVSNAKTEQAFADAEEAKKDVRQFTGPTDYGQLSFDYPKTWSLYVESDASKGGDFVAYLNPIEIEPVSDSTVYALRVTIKDKDFESVTKEYQRPLEKGELSVETVTVGENEVTANRYTGVIPGTDLNGIIVIFKIRDKTAVLRTDSVLMDSDFQTILNSVKFNE